jgi:hypothetical protein
MKEIESPQKLITVARAISVAIGSDSCALIGGMALAAFGCIRGTVDVDFIASGYPKEISETLAAKGIKSEVRFGEHGDPLPWVVCGYIGDVRFDIIPQIANTKVERALLIESFGSSICSLEDLVALKCYAGGPQDLLDVANLVKTCPDIYETALYG